jgi:hypothetical protein
MSNTTKKSTKPRRNWKAVARERAALGLPKRGRGGQPGNINRLTHGRYSGYYLSRRAHVQDLVRSTNALIARIKLASKLGMIPKGSLSARFRGDPSPPPYCGRRFEYTHQICQVPGSKESFEIAEANCTSESRAI